MNSNFRVGSLFGIPFYVNVSWFLVFGLTALSFGSGLAQQFPAFAPYSLGMGLIAGLLMFGSVLLHELGHSIAAQQQGITVRSITLFLFGGMARLEKDADTAPGAFKIAIAGPLVSLTLFLGLTTITGSGIVAGPVAAVVSPLAYVNLMLAVFNMIPGLPLDGGNVLKALVWQVTGDRYRGIRWASRTGQFVAWIAIMIGIFSMLGLSTLGNFWTFLLGVFLLQNAKQSGRVAAMEELMSFVRGDHDSMPDQQQWVGQQQVAYEPVRVRATTIDIPSVEIH